jgi:glycine cleavage system H protein
MEIPEHLRYTKDHEWIAVEDNGRVRMGITHYAQDALGDIVFVQLPEIGAKVQTGITFTEVESTKSVSDIYGPITGTVVEVNHALADAPQKVNEEPYAAGWICVIEPAAEMDESELLDAGAYRSLVEA